MISNRTDRIVLNVLVAGLLAATASCTLVTERLGARAAKSAPAVAGSPEPEVVPVSVPSTSGAPDAAPSRVERREQPQATQAPAAAAERPANDADDPRAVIDWLLNPSSVRGR